MSTTFARASYNRPHVKLGAPKPKPQKYNVEYTNRVGNKYLYLAKDVSSYSQALSACNAFKQKYVGKPFPDGRGFYDFRNVRVISR